MRDVLMCFKSVVKRDPEGVAITHHFRRDNASSVTWRELDQLSDAVASYLLGAGLQPNEFVGIFMKKSIPHVSAILGVLKAGGAFISINPRSRCPQVKLIAETARCRRVFIDNDALIQLSASGGVDYPAVGFVHYSSEAMSQIHEMMRQKIAAATTVETFPSSAGIGDSGEVGALMNDVGFALFTSGSTGVPKGVLISRGDLLNRVETEAEDFELSREDCLLSLLPFSFDVGCNQLFTSLITGAPLVIMNSWLPKDIELAIQEYGISGISSVPVIWAGVMEHGDASTRQAIQKLRYLTVSGGDLSQKQLMELREFCGNVAIYKTYGQTETFRSCILKPHEFEGNMTSVGRAVRGTEVFIVNRAGKRLRAGEDGEIIHRGDGTMMGYLGNLSATRKKLRRNPLQHPGSPCPQTVVYTGDYGRMDQGGYVRVLGRRDKMIKTSGFRVYPREIVDQILSSGWIRDAVAFGVKDREIGEAIWCEVELKTGGQISEADIRRYLLERLPAYMVPARIFFVSSFPRTSSGKVRLAEVASKYNA